MGPLWLWHMSVWIKTGSKKHLLEIDLALRGVMLVQKVHHLCVGVKIDKLRSCNVCGCFFPLLLQLADRHACTHSSNNTCHILYVSNYLVQKYTRLKHYLPSALFYMRDNVRDGKVLLTDSELIATLKSLEIIQHPSSGVLWSSRAVGTFLIELQTQFPLFVKTVLLFRVKWNIKGSFQFCCLHTKLITVQSIIVSMEAY